MEFNLRGVTKTEVPPFQMALCMEFTTVLSFTRIIPQLRKKVNTMNPIIGFHFQEPVNDWPQSITNSLDNTLHQFFQVQMCSEAKDSNPTCKTVLRYHVDDQDYYLFAGDKKQAAREFFSRFIDATFDIHAPNVDFVCELNEYFATGEPDTSRLEKIAWCRAVTEVWHYEYKSQQKYSHIDLVLCRTAIGNDIPLECARIAEQFNFVLSYHCYVPVQSGTIMGSSNDVYSKGLTTGFSAIDGNFRKYENYVLMPTKRLDKSAKGENDTEWKYLSGRWTEMDRYYKSHGVTVRWMSTEIGAVGYTLHPNGSISLHAWDGWLHQDVYDGDLNGYLSMFEYFAGNVAQWNRDNDNRFIGGTIFTSNRDPANWKHFRVIQPDLNTIANHFKTWIPPVPPESTLRQKLYEVATDNEEIRIVDGAFLSSEPHGDYLPTSNEIDFRYENIAYRLLAFRHYQTQFLRVRYAKIGDWGNVLFEDYRNGR